MGEAKRKQRGTAAFLKKHPWCCYCGGATPANTRDHVPSIQMFSLRNRPKDPRQDFEVPACDECNGATSNHEQVAALLGRIYPNRNTPDKRKELQDITRAVMNNNPAVLKEIASGLSKCGVGGIFTGGPLLNCSVQIFGAKLGFALHYATTKRIVPHTGGVAVRWYSNFDALAGEIPPGLIDLLGLPQTLRQGKKHVTNQFEYASCKTDAEDTAIYYCTFRESFSVASYVSEDISRLALDKFQSNEFHRPGEFKLLRECGGRQSSPTAGS